MMRKLANETWFQHRASLDLSLGDMMRHLCSVVNEAKQLIADEAARFIVDIKRSVPPRSSVINQLIISYLIDYLLYCWA